MPGSSAIVDRPIERVSSSPDDDPERVPALDRLAVEAPIELRIVDGPTVVAMRTPGDDEDWARGFLLSEGVIGSVDDVVSLERPPAAGLKPDEVGNVLVVELAAAARPELADREMFASSSCGVCGKGAIETLAIRAPFVASDVALARDQVMRMPPRLRRDQTVFTATGGLHAAAVFGADGEVACLREDVGRHNAVDKVLGWAVAHRRLPLATSALCVSGRLGFEIIQKAIIAGIPIVVAVSAPTSLAVDLADRFGVTVCGFVRDQRFNIYTHPRRIVG